MIRERFIETGTYMGDTLASALKHPFQHLDSCELSENLYKYCRSAFANEPRVTLHHGSSPEFLSGALRDVPTMFWLDAHFSGKPNPREAAFPECPLLAELDVILAFPWTTRPIIIIDDSHMFEEDFWSGPNAWRFTRSEWPTLGEIVKRLAGYSLEMRDHKIFAT